jgi:hypothetical protein
LQQKIGAALWLGAKKSAALQKSHSPDDAMNESSDAALFAPRGKRVD